MPPVADWKAEEKIYFSYLTDVVWQSIGVRAIFFQGAELSLPEKFFDSARKTAMLTCKITHNFFHQEQRQKIYKESVKTY